MLRQDARYGEVLRSRDQVSFVFLLEVNVKNGGVFKYPDLFQFHN